MTCHPSLRRSLLTLLSVPRTLGRRRFAPPDGRAQAFSRDRWHAPPLSVMADTPRACPRQPYALLYVPRTYGRKRFARSGRDTRAWTLRACRARTLHVHASRAALRMTLPTLLVKTHNQEK